MEIVKEPVPVEAADGLSSPKDRTPQRVVRPVALGKDFMDQIVRRVLRHLDLLLDYLAFLLDVVRLEERISYKVCQDVYGAGQVFVEDFDRKTRTLFSRECVEVPPDRVRGPGNLLGRAVRCPFEDHVLKEMRDAVFGLALVPGSRPQPDPHRHGAHVGDGLRDNR